MLGNLGNGDLGGDEESGSIGEQGAVQSLESGLDKGLSAFGRSQFRVSNNELIGDTRVTVVYVQVGSESSLSRQVRDSCHGGDFTIRTKGGGRNVLEIN